MQNTLHRMDNLMARLLFVTPENTTPTQAETTDASEIIERAENAFSFALLFSGVRCIIMYVVLPFILPLIGVIGTFSIWLDIGINLIAIVAIIYSLRRFWIVDYKRKWQYLPVAVVALFLLVAFIGLDISMLLENAQA